MFLLFFSPSLFPCRSLVLLRLTLAALSRLQNIGIPVELAISKNLFQPPSATQSDPTLPPDEWAEAFVDQKHFHSVEAVLKGPFFSVSPSPRSSEGDF